MSTTALLLDEALAGLLMNLRVEQRSEHTIRFYQDRLRPFRHWLEQYLPHATSLTDITTAHLRAFVAWLQGQKLSSATVAGTVRTLRVLFNFLEREEAIDKNPMQRIRTPKLARKLPEHFTQEEVEKLLAACDHRRRMGARNKAILLLFLDTGIRLSELCGLRVQDVDLEHGRIWVWGKGRKQRCLAIDGVTRLALWRYRAHHRQRSDVDAFFLTEEGQALQPMGVRIMLSRLGQAAGVSHCHAHKFRHTFATMALAAGANPFEVQDYLGHESLQMTRWYTNAMRGEVASQAHRRFSPVRALGVK